MVNSYRKNSPVGIFEKTKWKGENMQVAVGIIVGFALCYVIGKLKKPSGTFVIDTSDPMKDICRFEMDESLNSIYSKKRIWLRIKVITDETR